MAKVTITATVTKKAATKRAPSFKGRAKRSLNKAIKFALKAIPGRLSDRDRGYRKRLKEIKRFRDLRIEVGVLQSEGAQRHRGSNLTVAEIGAFHEFGTKRIPRRAFIRGWYDEKQAEAKAAIGAMAESVVRGKRTADEAANILGQAFVGGIQKRISGGIPPALAASTIKQKKSSVPLVDTGQLRTSITYQIRRN